MRPKAWFPLGRHVAAFPGEIHKPCRWSGFTSGPYQAAALDVVRVGQEKCRGAARFSGSGLWTIRLFAGDRRVVEIATATRGQRVGALGDHDSGGDGDAVGGRGLSRDAQVLLIQPRPETRREIAGQDPLAVNLEHAARRKSSQQGLPYFRGVDAGGSRERKRLADTSQRTANRDLIADLADLA